MFFTSWWCLFHFWIVFWEDFFFLLFLLTFFSRYVFFFVPQWLSSFSDEIPPQFVPYLDTSVPVVSLVQTVLASGTCCTCSDVLNVWYSSACFFIHLQSVLSLVSVVFPAQRIRVGSRIGHVQSDRFALLFSVMSRETVGDTAHAQSHEHVFVVS